MNNSNTISNAVTVLPDPLATSTKSVPANTSLDNFLSGVMRDVQACTDAKCTGELPTMLARDDVTPADVGYYLRTHLGRIRGDLRDALRHAKICNQVDVETILRTVAVELVNQYNRSRSQELQAIQRGQAANASDSIKERLHARLLARMQRTALSREFSASEVDLLIKHAEDGNHRIAENMAGRAVRFLAESTDWQATANELCAINGGGSVTAAVEPQDVLGNSVLLKTSNTGWTLSIWADSGWMPIQASGAVLGQAKAERAAFNQMRRNAAKPPLSTGNGLFADELR